MTINRLRLFALFFAVIPLVYFADAHPAYQHHFNRIVDADPCLKACMDAATSQDHELSMLKTANVSAFLLNLDHVCSTIQTARDCVAGCNISSNPFELESMRAPCVAASRADARLLTPCLAAHGYQMADDCEAACGDFDAIHDEIHRLSAKYQPEFEEAEKVADVLHKVNEGCTTLKCSNRCLLREMRQRCDEAADGRRPAAIFRAIAERVLNAQRQDLDRMKLTDTMAQSVPLQCNYMYMPEVMFDVEKDELALTSIGESLRNEHHLKLVDLLRGEGRAENGTESGAADGGRAGAHAELRDETILSSRKHLSFALSQLQARMLHKQMELLHLQELNVKKEAKKLDIELELAVRKMNLMRQTEKDAAAAKKSLK